jgi:hypothetical protein
VEVTPVIVFVDLADITEKGMPADVHVTTRRRLRRWLTSLPSNLGSAEVDEIYAQARNSSTWR